MLKQKFHEDEYERQASGENPLFKVEKIVKKEMMDSEKPIDPKYVFNDYKKSKADKGKKYRKPKPETDGTKKKPKLITLDNW